MKIQLLSDLHLENNPTFVASPTPGADLLAVSYTHLTLPTNREV